MFGWLLQQAILSGVSCKILLNAVITWVLFVGSNPFGLLFISLNTAILFLLRDNFVKIFGSVIVFIIE